MLETQDADLDRVLTVNCNGVLYTCQKVAHTVLHLVSDASSFTTEQILRPNGGLAMPW